MNYEPGDIEKSVFECFGVKKVNSMEFSPNKPQFIISLIKTDYVKVKVNKFVVVTNPSLANYYLDPNAAKDETIKEAINLLGMTHYNLKNILEEKGYLK